VRRLAPIIGELLAAFGPEVRLMKGGPQAEGFGQEQIQKALVPLTMAIFKTL